MTMETRITSLIVLPEGEPIFSERATIVRIEDEAGGEYIVVSQDSIPGRGNVAINPEEWAGHVLRFCGEAGVAGEVMR